jgi:hypothetical protein
MSLPFDLPALIILSKIPPMRKPLSTKKISTPIAPKNLIIVRINDSISGYINRLVCEKRTSKIATALMTSSPNILLE